ncbi:MAG: TonB-dependent receptor plug domain-containing protein, partial [Segetibacter sp.]
MNKKFYYHLTSCLLIMLFSTGLSIKANAQITVTGSVNALEGKESLNGVTVAIKGTTLGTSTNANGQYTLKNVNPNATLVFSYLAFTNQEVLVNGQSVINVTMEPDSKVLQNVVVVGYGTQKKRNVTGAVGSVKFDQDISSRPMVEFGQALSGKVAGVQVLTASGRPGSSSTVQIRGIASISANSSPLIVVDGNPLPSYDLNLINSADIESIDILKDASSAAIYGSRGGNGVILITTKSGKSGKARLDFSYTTTLQKPIDKVEMMNSREYALAS